MRLPWVYLSKGGVGKTTLVALLGMYLAGRGYRVVIVDLDIQGSQSTAFDLVDETGRGRDVLHQVLKRRLDVLPALTQVPDSMIPVFAGEVHEHGELFVLQGGAQTKAAIDEIASNPVRFKMTSTLDVVRGPVAALAGYADFVLLDMGPSDQVSALAGLVATDYLIMPTTMDYLSVERIAPVLDEVEVARQVQDITVMGVVPMMTRYYFGGLRKAHNLQAGEQYLQANYEALLLKDSGGMIDFPYAEDVRKVMWAGVSLFEADVNKKAKESALRICDRVMATFGLKAVTHV